MREYLSLVRVKLQNAEVLNLVYCLLIRICIRVLEFYLEVVFLLKAL